MKPIQWIGVICLVSLSVISFSALAQNNLNNNVPQSISASFTTKYPGAQIKSCKQNKTGYDIKFILDHKKYLAVFDKQCNWYETNSNVSWQWKLPDAVKTGLKKSPHGTWHPYEVNLVETSKGQFYRVKVDNTNNPINFAHQLVLTQDVEIDVNTAGQVLNEKYID
jgi:hypothetical protein